MNRKDNYYRLAKKEGFRSRASFKLIEIDQKFSILGRGMRVLEIGASPGGWTDVIIQTEPSYLLCVDIQGKTSRGFPDTIKGDIRRNETWEKIREFSEGMPFDIIVSDAMTHTTGKSDLDHGASLEICNAVLSEGVKTLSNGGAMLLKQFQGTYTEEFIKKAQMYFHVVKVTKPSASRKESREIYIIMKGFHW
ncbi:SAM-dependent methyltransferase [Caldiplasma sukawensis]